MESATTQPNRDHPDLQITVHEYLNSNLVSRLSQNNVLREGYQTVNAARSRDHLWKSGQHSSTEAIVRTRKAYVFNKTPPSIKPTSSVSYELKEWGTTVTEDEVYTLDDLEEFNASQFSNSLTDETSESAQEISTATPAPSSETRRKRARDENLSMEPQNKRRMLRTGSLFRVIPQPHMHTSMFGIKERTFKSAFNKLQPKFIAPYTKATFPNNSRLGWLIPIRGSFPWEGCTPGEMLDDFDNPSSGKSRNIDSISWSEDTLVKFWNYLLELRKLGKLGQLAISFHPSREPKQSAQSSRSGLPSDTSKLMRPIESMLAFSKIDFIKVYHDAQNAMYVRKALDLFSYPYSHKDGRIEKIRMLKGARLALVNEISQGILVI